MLQTLLPVTVGSRTLDFCEVKALLDRNYIFFQENFPFPETGRIYHLAIPHIQFLIHFETEPDPNGCDLPALEAGWTVLRVQVDALTEIIPGELLRRILPLV